MSAGKTPGNAGWIRVMQDLEERRAYLCRLTPDRALESLRDAHDFLHDRGLLTRTPDSALPSLFEACHEEPYKAGSRGFGSWPATKYPWYFELAARADVHELKVHNGKSILFTNETLPLVDSICRSELARMEQEDEWSHLLRHLAAAGPSTTADLQTELELKTKASAAEPLSAAACALNFRTAATRTRASSCVTTRPTQSPPRPRTALTISSSRPCAPPCSHRSASSGASGSAGRGSSRTTWPNAWSARGGSSVRRPGG